MGSAEQIRSQLYPKSWLTMLLRLSPNFAILSGTTAREINIPVSSRFPSRGHQRYAAKVSTDFSTQLELLRQLQGNLHFALNDPAVREQCENNEMEHFSANIFHRSPSLSLSTTFRYNPIVFIPACCAVFFILPVVGI